MMLAVACVRKSGGSFCCEHVDRLRRMVDEHLACDHRFICLSDACSGGCKAEKRDLIYDLPGYWSKIELFEIDQPTVYFDLDTTILDDITLLAELAQSMPAGKLAMIRRFRKPGWASGIMAWSGGMQWLMREFVSKRAFGGVFLHVKKGPIFAVNGSTFVGDQNFIAGAMADDDIVSINDVLPGIYSWRHDCRRRMPADARVVCFHGQPRPWELGHELSPVRTPHTKGSR